MGPKSLSGGVGGPDGYLRPVQFLDHLTVIKTAYFEQTKGNVCTWTTFDVCFEEKRKDSFEWQAEW